MKKSRILASTVGLLLTCGSARAELLAYEPFATDGADYAPGTIVGQSPFSFGLSGPWINTRPQDPVTLEIVPSSIDVAGFTATGGSARMSGTNNSTEYIYPIFRRSLASTAAGDVLYFSFFFRQNDKTTSQRNYLRLAGPNGQWVDLGTNNGGLDLRSNLNVDTTVTPPAGSTSQFKNYGGNNTIEQLVVKIDRPGNTVKFWRNPGIGLTADPAAAADAMLNITGGTRSASFNVIELSCGMANTAGGTLTRVATFDEIRIGRTIDDVTSATVIPPPVDPAEVVALDQDANTLGDVWEQFHEALALDPNLDSDGDGVSNFNESLAGTDPFDSTSLLQVNAITLENGDVLLDYPAQSGKRYRFHGSPTPVFADSSPLATSTVTGPGGQILRNQRLSDEALASRRFFFVEPFDVDSDGDGLSDWEELQLPGFSPFNPQSVVPGQNDRVTLLSWMTGSADVITVSTPEPDALEKEGTPARITFSRTGSLRKLTVNFALSGNPDAQKGSASPADYQLTDSLGNPVSTSVTLPFGARSVDLLVTPTADAMAEVPEMLVLTVQAAPTYTLQGASTAAVTIRDAANTAANERLLVAYLTSQGSAVTNASGISTVRLSGDNSLGLVNLSFSNLTSNQTATHIHIPTSPGGSGPDIKGLPPGQVVDNHWTIAASQFLATDQAVLNALLSGQLYVNVHSANYPDGEIRGNYQIATGSIDPPIPDDPPPVATLTGEALKRDVARFLTQSTFGPTQLEIDALTNSIETTHGGDRIQGYAAWIDQQFGYTQTLVEAMNRAEDADEFTRRGTTVETYTGNNHPDFYNRHVAWWNVAANARDQLRQRAGFALSQIFVVAERELRAFHYASAKYYDRLGHHADGNFSALLKEVSKNPVMAAYLSHLKNQKQVVDPVTGDVLVSPDENYAREIMQLFSIGLVQLHQDGSLKLDSGGLPIPTYSNKDITELARVFTGWSFAFRQEGPPNYALSNNNNFFHPNFYRPYDRYFPGAWSNPMKNFAAYHDTGAKNVLGTAIPAGLNGEQDLDAVIDILHNHPNTAPFISRLLIQRFVIANPSAGYIYRVAGKFDNDGSGNRGNLKAVFRAILLDPEARSLELTQNVGFGKQKEPIIRYAQLLRAFGASNLFPISDLASSGLPAAQLANFPAGSSRLRFRTSAANNNLGQAAGDAPSVFNFFLPEYTPGGGLAAAGLVSPEMQLVTESFVYTNANFHRIVLEFAQGTATPFGSNWYDGQLYINRLPMEQLLASEIASGKDNRGAVTTLVDRLDLLLMAGGLKQRYANAPTPNPRDSIITQATAMNNHENRVKAALYLISNSPEFLHQK